jgi:uncharacterized damage-inducible protein DinB
MKSYLLSFALLLVICFDVTSQIDRAINKNSDLPYRQIPDYPDYYTPENVAARLIDGLGYRYFWATEGLTQKDLDYNPGNGGRSTLETIEHIYGLSRTILNGSLNKPNVYPRAEQDHTFAEIRKLTLENLESASRALKERDSNSMENLKIISKRQQGTNESPYWNMLNGPISDAIYHTGQVVSFRRSSGNPINPKVNVFSGKTAE